MKLISKIIALQLILLPILACDTGLPDGPVPVNKAQALYFQDQNGEENITGTAMITAAADDTDIDFYRLYFSYGDCETIGGWIAELEVTHPTLEYVLNDVTVPEQATELIVISKNQYGEMADCTSSYGNPETDLNRIDQPALPAQAPVSVAFFDIDPEADLIAGTITIEPAADESDISSYVIYFGDASNCIMPGSSAIGEISAQKNGELILYFISGSIGIPSNAPNILVYSKNSNGEMDGCGNNASTLVDDYIDNDPEPPPLVPPTDLHKTGAGCCDTYGNFAWTPTPLNDGYEIHMDGYFGGGCLTDHSAVIEGQVGSGQVRAFGLCLGSKYDVKIRARRNGEWSAWSSTTRITL